LPVGIPQFAAVKSQVASGLKPAIDGGLDWLQANGYRTVLHLRQPGEDDSADRKQVEKYGMRLLSLEVAPENLARTVELFNRTIEDKANYPIFVYDKDGKLAGALWYLYFSTVERLDEKAARARAEQLGLTQIQNDATMWLAIQKFLSENQPKPK
jgi:protein tyrosine phosphatase (PTP) superfamily phosphohydrolase (DUF442 family)